MNELLESLLLAFRLIVTLDPEITRIIFTSLKIAFVSLGISCAAAIPAGIFISIYDFRLKGLLSGILSSMIAVPTVVIGLFVYGLVSRGGPLGHMKLLFSPSAIVIGQVIMAFPIITSFVISGISKLDPRFLETMITMGAGKFDILKGVIREARIVLLTSLLAGFGRISGEVGISMILGGNIKGLTRTITTAIALDTSRGEFVTALALGIILMTLAICLNLAVIFLIGDKSHVR